MEKNYFLAFFIIALVAGLSLGFSLHDTITGEVASRGVLVNTWTFDSDGGLDPDIQGFCQDSKGGYVDYCMDDMTLVEYMYNEQVGCYQAHYNCGQAGYVNGCQLGACQNGKAEKE